MKNSPMNINWENIWERNEDDPPAELEVVKDTIQKDNLDSLSDHQLDEKIQRMQCQKSIMVSTLPDRGAKYEATLKRLEEERERRKIYFVHIDADDFQKPAQSQRSSFCDSSHGFSSKSSTCQSHSQSQFAYYFQRLAVKSDKAFDRELACVNRSNHNSWRPNEPSIQTKRRETRMSSRHTPFRSPKSWCIDKDKHRSSNGDHEGFASSSYSTLHPEGNFSSRLSEKRRNTPIQTSNCSKSRKVQMVLLDEDDAQPIEPIQNDKSEGWISDAKIYYPSRNDPESVELCHSDMECLEPGFPLSSTIMNFYIQYLQKPESPTDRPIGDYHFFNTYFYKKLEEAISYKGSDKDTFYQKFRRWWKGVNIFQKAYIFLPIHADQHWSLVIICITARKYESGPIILHLDSLEYHSSSLIFSNVENYLKEEWKYLNQADAPPDVPISEKIWKNLSRRIERKVIPVPQQKNDYDCGLFVLFFMERFIEDAPGRPRKDDLRMFGKKWFKPEEASRLRVRIRHLLCKQFESSRLENGGSELHSSLDDSPEGSDVQCDDS
ncbi:ubiquitin-like-specific protease 1D isoform X2 [Tasmannia lanceolata]|uniref:ubiquitin-like-specific protease 1D isoform X2 n=1 Tax=Tasmannia lanceolata TaxID=3420 RepID=UPI0040635A75